MDGKAFAMFRCSEEAAGTASGSGAAWKDGKVDQGLVFTPDTEIKLVRYNAVRQA